MLGSQIKFIVVIKVTKNHSQCYNNFKFDRLKIKIIKEWFVWKVHTQIV